jgi:PAS domain S-box-containing protein
MLINQEQLNDSIQPIGLERGDALSNILKGYEDFTLDITGKIISSNLEAVNITGYEEWEAIGRHFSMFYTEQDRTANLPTQDLAKAKLDNKVTFTAWRVKKRNVTFWAQVTMACLKDSDGFVTGYKMILKDQTHRLISNNRVKRFRDEYLNLFNNPFIGIFKFRFADFKFLLINAAAGRTLGIDREQKKFSEIFNRSEEFDVFLHTLNRDKKVTGFEFQVNNKNGEAWARIDCLMFDSEGFVEGVVNDVTENKRQLGELKRLNEELDNFIYHASHDLRSPLTSLLGLINLIEFDTEIELKDYCNMMRERVTYLDDLLKDMTLIVFNSKSEVTVEPIDFTGLIQGLIEEFQPINPHINIIFNVTDGREFYCDKQRVIVIFKKLILNSLKHRNPHNETSYVEINVNAHNGKAHIHFKDNGRGIKDDHLLQIFGMFYKMSHEIRDTGLGLYITKLMVDKLQGKTIVKSKIGIGTEFEIELPNLKMHTSF